MKMSVCSFRPAYTSITLLLVLIGLSYADYNITYSFLLQGFESPPSTAPNGSCCGSSCQECCNVSTNCTRSLLLCFRERNLPITDTSASCGLNYTNVNLEPNSPFIQTSRDTTAVNRYYAGGFQAYIRISFIENTSAPDLLPPFSDPVIDEYAFNFNLTLSDMFSTNFKVFNETGLFGTALVRLSASAVCTIGWNGSSCSTFCNSSGCIQVYTGPFIEPLTGTTDPPNVTTESPITSPTNISPPVTQGIVADGNDDVAIGVGVGVGGALLIFLLLLLILILCCCCCKRKRKKEWELKQSYPYTVKPRDHPASVERPISTIDEPVTRSPPPDPRTEIELEERQPPQQPQPEEEVQEDNMDMAEGGEDITGSMTSIHLYTADATASLYAKVDKSRKRDSVEENASLDGEKEDNQLTVYENVVATDPSADQNEEDKESAL